VAKKYVPAEKIGRETLIKKNDLHKFNRWKLSEAAAESIYELYKATLKDFLGEKGRLIPGKRLELVPLDYPNAEKLSAEEHAEMRKRFMPILEGLLKDFSQNGRSEMLTKENKKATYRSRKSTK
jgi:hypothetical protein